MPGYHTKKDGTKAKKGLYYNINQKKKSGTSKTKAKSTITAKSYKNMPVSYTHLTLPTTPYV